MKEKGLIMNDFVVRSAIGFLIFIRMKEPINFNLICSSMLLLHSQKQHTGGKVKRVFQQLQPLLTAKALRLAFSNSK